MAEKLSKLEKLSDGVKEPLKDYISLTAYKVSGLTSESFVMFSGDKVFGSDLSTPNPVTTSPYSGNVVELSTTGQYIFKIKAKVACKLVYYNYRYDSTDTNPRTPSGTISLAQNQEYSFNLPRVENKITSINIVATEV